MRGSLLSVFVFSVFSIVSSVAMSAQAQALPTGLDKSALSGIVCAAVFPCNQITGAVLRPFLNPTTVEGEACLKFVYEPICKTAKKENNRSQRERSQKNKKRR